MQALKFLTPDLVRQIAAAYGTPVYVYSEAVLRKSAQTALAFPNAYGLTVRYAIKANSTGAILSLFNSMGIHFDASSSYEVHRLLLNGVHPSRIQLTAQELAPDLKELVERGIFFNACSLHQLETYGKGFPGRNVSIRINPGIGSGHSNRTNVGGPSSSFGIWIEHLEEIKALAAKYDLTINKLHSHIGSGSDPAVWEKVTKMNLDVVREFPEVHTLNMGGGFKIGRMPGEATTDLQVVGVRVKRFFTNFYNETGRKIKLEIEPGSFLVAANGALICSIDDKVDTGKEGYRFIKTDTGMSEILRPTLYGVQHPIKLVPKNGDIPGMQETVVVVGHSCESGDILTPTPGDAEGVDTITLPRSVIGDYLVIEDTGAYCASMCAVNYNSFPQAPEVLIRENGEATLIRKRQTLEQMMENEL
ncbi:MAG: diaminopimelate decarboxylase [Candidatus Marinimicrobia bacterium]|nr:diaminopimelate decarboxylase [Candidatus Neomarinimicrobiota bacterium]